MANKQTVFADRVVGLSIHNGLVRLDLAAYAGTAKNKEEKTGYKFEVTHQLVLPLDAFVQATNMQNKLINELAARQKQQAEAAAQPAVEAPAA